jgi:hypothetical protein
MSNEEVMATYAVNEFCHLSHPKMHYRVTTTGIVSKCKDKKIKISMGDDTTSALELQQGTYEQASQQYQ